MSEAPAAIGACPSTYAWARTWGQAASRRQLRGITARHQMFTGSRRRRSKSVGAMDFVELHFHLLPGVDDGPRTMDESLELARAAVADGTTTVVTTPHVHPYFITNPAEIAGRVGELTQQLRAADIDLEVLPGGELAYEMVGRLGPVELDHIAQGPPGRRWILLEGTLTGLDPDFTVAADRLRSWGFGVVVAHPERARQTTDTAAAIDT